MIEKCNPHRVSVFRDARKLASHHAFGACTFRNVSLRDRRSAFARSISPAPSVKLSSTGSLSPDVSEDGWSHLLTTLQQRSQLQALLIEVFPRFPPDGGQRLHSVKHQKAVKTQAPVSGLRCWSAKPPTGQAEAVSHDRPSLTWFGFKPRPPKTAGSGRCWCFKLKAA